jgi:hypothetical protein
MLRPYVGIYTRGFQNVFGRTLRFQRLLSNVPEGHFLYNQIKEDHSDNFISLFLFCSPSLGTVGAAFVFTCQLPRCSSQTCYIFYVLGYKIRFKKVLLHFLHPKVHFYFTWVPRKFICNHTCSTCVTELEKHWFIERKQEMGLTDLLETVCIGHRGMKHLFN